MDTASNMAMELAQQLLAQRRAEKSAACPPTSGEPPKPSPTAAPTESEPKRARPLPPLPNPTGCACGGSGWLALDVPKHHADFGKLVRCPNCTDFLRYSRLTPEEQQHTMDDIKDRQDDPRGEMLALRFLGKRMLDDPFGFLSIYGRTGSAKSLLLTALVAEFCRRGREARYFNAGEIVALLSPGEDKPIDGFQHVSGHPEIAKKRLKEVTVLAIDELDKIRWTAWQIQQIGEVIEWRHRHMATLVTLISMNKPPWEWHNAGEVEHIASRLQDGRFVRRWPDEYRAKMPKCLNGNPDVPGLFEVTLPDIRPILRRESHAN